jgi:flagellar hook-associated protein 2
MFSIDGIVSGFDTSSIIESLLGFQQTQLDTFNSRKAEIATKQSSFKGIEAQLLTMQASLSRLNRTSASVFDVKSASSSHEEILQVAADSKANNGSYQLTVDSLATAHQVASQGFSTTSDQVGTGEISFKVGDRAESTITIDQGNNTLSGLVTAINDQVEDVTASVVFDQGSSSYRILLTSNHTGATNNISVTANLDPGSGTAPDFSGPAVQAAADAVITLGSGPGAITAQFAANKVEDLIENVTIDLQSASPGTTVNIKVAADTTAAQEAIETFVADFNSVIEFIDSQTRFSPETNQASPLLGNRSVSDLKNRLLTAVTDTVATNSELSRLGQIGIDLNTRGQLVIDSQKLGQALNGELDNVDAGDIRNLFGLNASSSNSGIEFLTGGTRTQDSLIPYQVDITQAAEQASITATNALAGSVVIDDNNNTFQITIDGIVSETLTLATGTYTQEELATHLQNTIGGSSELGVHNANVSLSAANELVITSEAYGSASRVASVSGAASAVLGFDGSENDIGQDVAGVFIVDGEAEIANGSGRVLSGHPDNPNTADLQLRVTLTPDRIIAGVDGEVQVSRGVSGRLDVYINRILNGETGLLKTVNDEFESKIESIDRSIKRVEDLTESKREYLIAEFTALERIISELQNTGSFISTQLASISSFSQNKSK